MTRPSAALLVLDQPPRGSAYRFNVDAFLLARFAQPARAVDCVCDLGAGVGAVGLSLLHAGAAARAMLIEIDRVAAAFARDNAQKNGFEARVEVVLGDVLEVAHARRGDAGLVVCNPPYITPGRGRTPAAPARARARMGSLPHFIEAARLVAGRRARVAVVYPAGETLTLLATMRRYGLEPKRLTYVHKNANAAARIVLVEARAAKAGGLVVESPIIEST